MMNPVAPVIQGVVRRPAAVSSIDPSPRLVSRRVLMRMNVTMRLPRQPNALKQVETNAIAVTSRGRPGSWGAWHVCCSRAKKVRRRLKLLMMKVMLQKPMMT